jgi:hypothetical protein
MSTIGNSVQNLEEQSPYKSSSLTSKPSGLEIRESLSLICLRNDTFSPECGMVINLKIFQDMNSLTYVFIYSREGIFGIVVGSYFA